MYDDSDFPAGSVHYPGGVVAPMPTLPGTAPRASLEAFIADRYAAAYDARVEHFCRHLVGIPGQGPGRWRAGVGYTPAADHALYLEHYLEEPIEDAIEAATGVAVPRDRIVEVGNLAGTSTGAAREIIVAMHACLRRANFTQVTFTATRELRNSFTRLGLAVTLLTRADPSRLPDGGMAWGRYYAHDPMVVTGTLGALRSVAVTRRERA